MKSIYDSQKKNSELTGSNDALSITIVQLEKERDGLLEEIQEYRQVLAAADSKINEYEALHASANHSTVQSPGPRAWNLSEPTKAVNQGDTYVLQSSPEKLVLPSALKEAEPQENNSSPDEEFDEYSDMLQVFFRGKAYQFL